MDRTRLVGVGLVVMSAFAFGSGPLFAKPAYEAGTDWHVLSAWRFGIGAALGWAWVLVVPGHRAGLRRIGGRAAAIAVALGVLYTANSGTYYAGLETVPASLAALVVYIYPVLVAVLALQFGRRLEGARAWTALAIAVTGVGLAVGGIDPGAMPPLDGLVLIIASPVIYAVWIVLAARLSGERRDTTGTDAETGAAAAAATALMMTGTAATYWLSALVVGRDVLPGQVPLDAWPWLLAIGTVSAFVAIQGFYAGAQRVGAAQAALISTVEPIWTIVLAAILFTERLGPIQLFGGAMILGGVILAQTARQRSTATRSANQPAIAADIADRAASVTNAASDPMPRNR